MKEFSPTEKEIIEKLIIGVRIEELFLEKEYYVEISPPDQANKKLSRFKIIAVNNFNIEVINEDVVTIVTLLMYLEENHLCIVLPPPTTSLPKYEFELGRKIHNTIPRIMLFQDKSENLIQYIRDNWPYKFKATEQLRLLRANNYLSQEEIRHIQSLQKATTSNRIAIGTALLAIVFSMYQANTNYAEVNSKFERTIKEMDSLLTETEKHTKEQVEKRKEFDKKVNEIGYSVRSQLDSLNDKLEIMKIELTKRKK